MPSQSVPVRDSAFPARVLQQYLLLLKKYPILTKSVTRSVYIFVKASLLALALCVSHSLNFINNIQSFANNCSVPFLTPIKVLLLRTDDLYSRFILAVIVEK